MEFVIGGLSAVGAGCFTNPLEVVKTRLQLQGELKARGQYAVHYRNFFHAFYVIGKNDGILALQKGLVPALWHQILLNGTRLGIYQFAEERKWHLKPNSQDVSFFNTLCISASAGAIGAYTGSPLYLVKVHLQSKAAQSIAVGFQHDHEGTLHALKSIHNKHGLLGLWRGVTGAVPRLAVGSASQLGTFYTFREFLETHQLLTKEKSLLNTIVASFMGGFAAAVFMSPLDVISTRLYNQGVDSQGRGLLYSSYFDCVTKIWRSEGIRGLYKGFVPCFARIGPHTVLCLVFWDLLKEVQKTLTKKYMNS
uniref:Solute carrier family 25 member 35 n=1 Tax=Clastoptera arizonana TaxID=38151 RepID=A0A1B6D351_9HEMI